MLIYSSMASTKETLTPDVFVDLIITWNQGGKFNRIDGIDKIRENRNVRIGTKDLWLEIQEYRDKNIIATRLEQNDRRGSVWDADFVVNFNERRLLARLDRSFVYDGSKLAAFRGKPPYFINLLIDRGYLEKDDLFPVLYRPIEINEDNLNDLRDVISGRAQCQMPVVYVSKDAVDHDPLNVDELCKRLKGLAHILVEKEKRLNREIQYACESRNEYNGAVGLYFPCSELKPMRFHHDDYWHNPNQLADDVVDAVCEYVAHAKVDPLYTWDGVRYELLKARWKSRGEDVKLAAEKLQEADKQSSSIAEINAAFDQFSKEMELELNELREENKRLQKEALELQSNTAALAQRLKSAPDNAIPLLYYDPSQEFFPEEFREMAAQALAQSCDPNRERRYDVLKAIILFNGYNLKDNGNLIKNKGGNAKLEVEQRVDILKNELQKNRNKDELSSVQKIFNRMGILVGQAENNHVKLIYVGDAGMEAVRRQKKNNRNPKNQLRSKYVEIISSTPSSARSGKNASHRIINAWF
ncbi:MAG: hypothetical protein IJL92_04345 [Thermoguttaceae bacterium]|nr:hypothetical protein [Thermoguttaceae bacterium]